MPCNGFRGLLSVLSIQNYIFDNFMEKSYFASFPSTNHAKELTDILEGKIPYEIEIDAKPLSDFYLGQTTALPVHVKIEPALFNQAHELWASEIEKSDLTEIPEYLAQSTTDELLEIVKSPFQYSYFDQIIAKKLLANHGIQLDANYIHQLKEERINELKKPISASTIFLLLGYLSPVSIILLLMLFFRFWFFWSFFGIAIGLYLCTKKKTVPDGSRVYTYTKASRTHGLIIALIYFILTVAGSILIIKDLRI